MIESCIRVDIFIVVQVPSNRQAGANAVLVDYFVWWDSLGQADGKTENARESGAFPRNRRLEPNTTLRLENR